MRLLARWCVVLLLLALAECGDTATGPNAKALEGMIVLQKDVVSENRQIFIIRPDGTGLRQVTRGGDNWWPKLSHDKTKIAWLRKTQGETGVPDTARIFIMNLDGTGRREIYTCQTYCYGNATWSPDDRWLAIGDFYVYLVSVVDSRVETLEPNPGDHIDWSPDGTKFVGAWYTPVAVMKSDGTGMVALQSQTEDAEPKWSPDGRRIAFMRLIDGWFDLFVIDADGSALRQLTASHLQDEVFPSWSPDGQYIAFSNSGLFIMRADGTGAARYIDTGPGFVFALDWR